MILKFVFLMMLTTSVFAGTAPLKSAFDDLTYSLTVEWDQKDQEFAQNSLSLFQMKVAGASIADKKEFFKTLTFTIVSFRRFFRKKSADCDSLILLN